MKGKIQKLLEMLSPRFDWDKHWEKDNAEGIEELFRKCVKLATSTEGDYHDCGSYKAEDTPRARQDGEPNDIDVFLHGGACDLTR